MEYRSGTIGRIFSIRFDDGDDFLEELKGLVKKENIACGWFHLIGGIRQADVVTGPREPTVPPEPVWREVRTPHEVLGMGSVFWDGAEVKIHLHTSLGHHGENMTVCLRKESRVYLILEVYLIEVTGFTVSRPWVDSLGFSRLTFNDIDLTGNHF